MRHAGLILTAVFVCVLPFHALAEGEGGATGGTTKKEDAKTAKAKKEPPEKSVLPPSKNLTLPADLAPETRKALEEAIAAYKSAEKATEGREKLITKAIAKLKSASSRAPKCPQPYYYLGIAYQMKRNFPQARTVLEKAVKLNPSFHEAFTELGDVYVWQKKLKESLPFYDTAFALEPSYSDSRERKGMALIRMGEFEAAQVEMRESLKAGETPNRKQLSFLLERELKGPGWKEPYTAETENYRVITSISEEYALEIAKHAELIRRAYDTIFSDIAKPDRKYTIWVYESKEAYHKAGGPPQAAGHYEPLVRKLVIPRQQRASDTFMVLYHEAFHQYLHDYMELAPQWFNEGLGDYFGAFEYVRQPGKEQMRSRPNPWRLQGVQFAIRQKILPSAADLMVMTREEMYEPRMAGYHYAQAWAMIFFIIEGNKPQYKPVLIAYFNAIRKGRDLDGAFAQTFGKIDMAKFDTEWKGFIANLGVSAR